jgi:hypothetical protein
MIRAWLHWLPVFPTMRGRAGFYAGIFSIRQLLHFPHGCGDWPAIYTGQVTYAGFSPRKRG